MDVALVRAVRTALAGAADPARAEGQQRYMRSTMPFHGVTTPEMRRIARREIAGGRELGRDEWEATVRALYDGATHREERYAAIELLRHRRYRSHRTTEALPLLEHLVTTGAWWDLVDACRPVVTELLLADPHAVTPWLRSWAHDDDLWLRRSALIAQLGATDRTDATLLREVVEVNLSHPDFFVRKAIGWALRQYARTDPAWVVAFVEEHRDALSPLSRREALKHLGPR